MHKYAIILAVVISGIASFLIGYYLFEIGNIENEKQNIILAENHNNYANSTKQISIKVNNNEQKISPNTNIIKKIYYIDCEHIKQEKEEIREDLINMNERNFQAEYIGWEIQRFTNNEVIIYKEVYDYCNEHYLIKEEDEKIVVYKIDKYDKEIEKIIETEIEINYLTESDLENIKEGIKVYSRKEVSKILEDFE